MLPIDTPVEITAGAAKGRVGFIDNREESRSGHISYCVRLVRPMDEMGLKHWWVDDNNIRVIGRRAKDPNIAFQMREKNGPK
jgi:hypothetical protein